jgi:hypothetical protein
MDARTRFMLGGIGGITPIILFLVNLDFERFVHTATTMQTVGYVVRAVLLFLLGGLVAYLHETEKKRLTLFLVGISAPSLIAGYLSTANLNPAQDRSPTLPIGNHAQFFFLPSAYAQTPTPLTTSDQIKRFTLPPQSEGSQFLEGLLGTRSRHVWFVIVGSHLDVNDARRQASSINQRFKNYQAAIYAPYADNPYYAVVIGAHLTQGEAKTLRDKAVRDGFPKSSYYKTFPGLPPAP